MQPVQIIPAAVRSLAMINQGDTTEKFEAPSF
jgi:hypothetical protein